jgi:2-oxo-4-hydroxy-4-carboxy-5-ureidoimidazoline decarboxylase
LTTKSTSYSGKPSILKGTTLPGDGEREDHRVTRRHFIAHIDGAAAVAGRRRFLFASTALCATGILSKTVRAQANGDLTAHALDSSIGRPAAGVNIDVFEAFDETPRHVAKVVTNNDGRADVFVGRPLKTGRYELRFAIGDYFRSRNIALENPPFLDVVPVRIYVEDPAGHYHVPLIFSPYSYAMYR